eukprot:4843035-Lingulodinium_polyedra.AAC.1
MDARDDAAAVGVPDCGRLWLSTMLEHRWRQTSSRHRVCPLSLREYKWLLKEAARQLRLSHAIVLRQFCRG